MTLVKFNSKTRNTAPYFNNVFDSLFSEALNKTQTMSRVPAVNIFEVQDAYKIQIAAPGLQKEDFQVNLKKDTLSVWVEQKMDDAQKVDYSRQEFDYTSFARSFNLPENANVDAIGAEYVQGILTISIAKVDEKMLSKEIKVL